MTKEVDKKRIEILETEPMSPLQIPSIYLYIKRKEGNVNHALAFVWFSGKFRK